MDKTPRLLYAGITAKRLSEQTLKEITEQCQQDSIHWWPSTFNDDLPFITLCMAGEIGEFANKVKKLAREQKTTRLIIDGEAHADLAEELADVFIYMMNAAGILGIDLYAQYQRKRAICEERWGAR